MKINVNINTHDIEVNMKFGERHSLHAMNMTSTSLKPVMQMYTPNIQISMPVRRALPICVTHPTPQFLTPSLYPPHIIPRQLSHSPRSSSGPILRPNPSRANSRILQCTNSNVPKPSREFIPSALGQKWLLISTR
jgi:hypothetical protein